MQALATLLRWFKEFLDMFTGKVSKQLLIDVGASGTGKTYPVKCMDPLPDPGIPSTQSFIPVLMEYRPAPGFASAKLSVIPSEPARIQLLAAYNITKDPSYKHTKINLRKKSNDPEPPAVISKEREEVQKRMDYGCVIMPCIVCMGHSGPWRCNHCKGTHEVSYMVPYYLYANPNTLDIRDWLLKGCHTLELTEDDREIALGNLKLDRSIGTNFIESKLEWDDKGNRRFKPFVPHPIQETKTDYEFTVDNIQDKYYIFQTTCIVCFHAGCTYCKGTGQLAIKAHKDLLPEYLVADYLLPKSQRVFMLSTQLVEEHILQRLDIERSELKDIQIYESQRRQASFRSNQGPRGLTGYTGAQGPKGYSGKW